MNARERAVEVLDAHYDGDRGPDVGESVMAVFDDAGLRVIEQPEPPYDTGADSVMWTGPDWVVLARPDGDIVVDIADPADPDAVTTVVLRADIAAAVSAAHIRAGDYQ